MSKNKDVKTATSAPDKLKRKKYEAELATLQAELVALQEWVKATGAKICIVFEGRDTAGKGGTIKRIVERVSPRVFRVVALPAPSAREKSQMYIQRYVPHLPAAGEVIIFDRSWYNRAGVERVMGFCTPDEVTRFLETAPAFEKAMIDSGIILIKYWLEVSPDEQTRRLKSRIDDPRKIWKLSNMDLESYGRWFDYSRARDDMFAATDTAWAPWYIAHTDNKRRGRLNIISHLLSEIPYKPLSNEQHHTPETTEAGRLPGTETLSTPHPDPVLIRVSTALRALMRREELDSARSEHADDQEGRSRGSSRVHCRVGPCACGAASRSRAVWSEDGELRSADGDPDPLTLEREGEPEVMRCRTSPGGGTRPARSTTAAFVSSPTRCSALGWGTCAGDGGRCPTTGPAAQIWPLCRICTPTISTSGRFPSCRDTFRWRSRAARCAPCPGCDGCATVNWSRSPRATRSAWGMSSSRWFRPSMTATGGPGLGGGRLPSGTS